MAKSAKKQLPAADRDALLKTVQERFEKNTQRHKGIKWDDVFAKLKNSPAKLQSLYEMEASGGEPDVIGQDKKTGEYLIVDCSTETPKDRRSLCYDTEALNARKANKPADSAMHLADEMGIDILDEEQYFQLQKLGDFDLKTSSWLKTPPEVRKLGGAIFGDKRFGRVFIYHNGADSYYGARAFRGMLKV